MKHEEANFEGVKNLKIFYQVWTPDSPKAIIHFIHGVAEHSGRYQNLINELASIRCAVYADDHRGHGRSEGRRLYVDSLDQFVEDERLIYDIIRDKHPHLPIFLMGYSLGALIAIHFVKKYEELLKGVILVGIPSSINVNIGFRFLAWFLSKIRPKMKYGDKMDPSLLNPDPDFIKAYENDPLVTHEPFTVRLGYELIRSGYEAMKVISTFQLPMLIQTGSEDRSTDVLGASIEMGEYETMSQMEDKTIKIYDGLCHDLYNIKEEDRRPVEKDLINWLNDHM